MGPDSQSVQRARELLELQEECIPLEHHQKELLYNSDIMCKFVAYFLLLIFASLIINSCLCA